MATPMQKMPALKQIIDQDIVIKNITDAVNKMQAPKSFLRSTPECPLRPAFAKEIKALYLLMHWSFLGPSEKLPDPTEISENGISLYGALMEHGRAHIVEIFMANEKDGSMLGTHAVYSIEFPHNHYQQEYDDWLINDLAQRTLGVEREQVVGHQVAPVGKAT